MGEELADPGKPTNAPPRPARPPAGESGVEVAPGVRMGAEALRFSFIQSGGPGGQNVNKRATKAELRIWVDEVPIAPDAKARLVELAGRRITEAGELVITSEEHRSQVRNRAECLQRLRELIVQARVRPRRRRATAPTRGSIERRLAEKKQVSERKRTRKGAGEGEA
jgi:ribosome-associated protein